MENDYESPLSELYLIDKKHVIEDANKRIKFDKYLKFLYDFSNKIPDEDAVMEILYKKNRRNEDYIIDDDFNCLNQDEAYGCGMDLVYMAGDFREQTFYDELIEEILTVVNSLNFEDNRKNYLQRIFDNLNIYYKFQFTELNRLANIHKEYNPSLHNDEEPISIFINMYKTDSYIDNCTIGEYIIIFLFHIYSHLQIIINKVEFELNVVSRLLFLNDTEILPNSHKLIILHKLGLFEPLIKIKDEHQLSTNDFTELVGNIFGLHEKGNLNGFRKALSSFQVEIMKKDYPIEVLTPKGKKETDKYLKNIGIDLSKLKYKLP
ncbi:hypothetical protein [Pedobacter helvus]|uniref:Uncharacterized protein n=1 Tax=Pedobacter helvus TaxID=2563444 RepID=A0ABW9JFP0_9SPHI|nr:hypothetical protein [Pedobacter ureilyticus]